MRKQALTVEWHIAENDADWERRCVLPLPSLALDAPRHRPLKRYFWSVAALFLLLASAGGWW